MAGASEGPPQFAKLHCFIFFWVPSASQGYSALSKIKVQYPQGIPSPTDTGQSLSHILVDMFSFKDEIFECI